MTENGLEEFERGNICICDPYSVSLVLSLHDLCKLVGRAVPAMLRIPVAGTARLTKLRKLFNVTQLKENLFGEDRHGNVWSH
jgi:hypothetical protein